MYEKIELGLKKKRIRQTVNNLLTVYMFSCRNSKKSSPYILLFFLIWNIHLYKTTLLNTVDEHKKEVYELYVYLFDTKIRSKMN